MTSKSVETVFQAQNARIFVCFLRLFIVNIPSHRVMRFMDGWDLRVCLVVSNDMTRDSRVDRHARALSLVGHNVTVLSRSSSGLQSRHERRTGYDVIRYNEPLLIHLSPNERTGLLIFNCLNTAARALLIALYRPWLYVKALRIRANVYHCNDLDTLDIGVLTKIAGRKLVYDSHELYVEQIQIGPLKALLSLIEGSFLKLVDVVITVNPFIASLLQRTYRIKRKIHVVLNCPESIGRLLNNRKRSRKVVLLYHGGLYPERGLENLVLASKHFQD